MFFFVFTLTLLNCYFYFYFNVIEIMIYLKFRRITILFHFCFSTNFHTIILTTKISTKTMIPFELRLILPYRLLFSIRNQYHLYLIRHKLSLLFIIIIITLSIINIIIIFNIFPIPSISSSRLFSSLLLMPLFK